MRPCCQIPPLKSLGKPGLGPVLGDKCEPDSELSKLASRLVRTKLEFIPWASIPRKRTMRESRVKCAVVTHSREQKGPAATVQDAYTRLEVYVSTEGIMKNSLEHEQSADDQGNSADGGRGAANGKGGRRTG